MHVKVVSPHELTELHRTEWRRLQRLDPVLESPYLCPEFVSIASQIRPGIIVAIAEQPIPEGIIPGKRARNGSRMPPS